MSDDASLLRRYAAKRAEDAFAELVRRHLDLVYSVALRRTGGDAHLASDIAQRVFTALARRAGSLPRGVVLTGWLYATTRHIAIDTVRSLQRRAARERVAHALNAVNTEPDPGWEQVRPLLEDAMDELAPRDREAVLLRYYQDRPFGEIGAAFGLSEDAARMRVDRALDKLHEALAKRGVTSTAAALGAVLGNALVAAPAGLAANVTSEALAGAWGGGLLAGAWTFMNSTKLGVGIATAIALGAGIVAVVARQSVRQAEADLATATASLQAATRERDSWSRQVGQLRLRAEQAEGRVTALQHTSPAAGGQDRATTAAPASARSNLSPRMALVLAHPELREAHVQETLLGKRASLERFFLGAGLTAAQREQVMKANAEYAAADLDLIEAMHARGFVNDWKGFSKETVAAMEKTIRDEQQARTAKFKASLQSALSEQQYAQYWEHTRTAGGHAVAGELAARLYFTGTPLTSQQANELAQALQRDGFLDTRGVVSIAGAAVSRKAYDEATKEQIWATGIRATPITDDAVAHAEAILAPPQLEVLRQLQARQSIALRFSAAGSVGAR